MLSDGWYSLERLGAPVKVWGWAGWCGGFTKDDVAAGGYAKGGGAKVHCGWGCTGGWAEFPGSLLLLGCHIGCPT